MDGAPGDLVLCLLWVPFATAALVAEADPSRLTWLIAMTLTLSFAHQPLTLWLVYGDAAQFAARRRLFSLSPVAMAAAVVLGLQVAPGLVIVVAAAWNAAHTMRQRYGIVRIYGRLVGQPDGRLDQHLLWSWLALAVALAVAHPDLGDDVARSGLGGRNRAALDGLAGLDRLAPLLVAVTLVVAVTCSVRWIRRERTRPQVNPAKWLYVASTAALLVVLAVHPVAGFVGYVGSHALEYALIVRRRLRRADATSGGVLFPVLRVSGPTGLLLGSGILAAALPVAVDRAASPSIATTFLLTIGGLHLLHDGFIWRLRRPDVRSGLGITTQPHLADHPTVRSPEHIT